MERCSWHKASPFSRFGWLFVAPLLLISPARDALGADVDVDGVDSAVDCDDNDPSVVAANCGDCSGTFTVDATSTEDDWQVVEDCRTIDGDLTIYSVGESLPDLKRLRYLTRVGGTFTIQGSELESTRGLERLTNVGSLEIKNNSLLKSLFGMDALEIVLNDAAISGNSSLVNISALESIGSVGGYFQIANNGLCTTAVDRVFGIVPVTGLTTNIGNSGDCTDVDGDLVYSDDCDDSAASGDLLGSTYDDADCDEVLTANDCDDSDPLELRTCAACIGSITLSNVASFADWSAVSTCRSVVGDLTIGPFTAHPSHDNAEPLAFLEGVYGTLTFQDSGPLSLDGMVEIKELGSFIIQNNDRTTNLSALANVRDLDKLTLSNAGTLATPVSFTGLENLQSLKQIDIQNAYIDQFTPLYNVAASNLKLRVINATGLTSLQGLENIVGFGALTLQNIPSLLDLGGLGALTTINDDFIVADNASLNDISSLTKLLTVGGAMAFTDNASLCLEDVNHLYGQLTSLGGPLTNSNNTGDCGSDPNDKDKDGVDAAFDCDDNDPALGDINYDRDCDGVLGTVDCDDDDPFTLLTCSDCPGPITIDISVPADWSAVETCNAINGDLTLEGTTTDSDYNMAVPLQYVANITGKLTLTNGGPDSILGLGNLTTLQDLELVNATTTNLGGLNNLVALGSITLNNVTIENLSGLQNLNLLNTLSIDTATNLSSLQVFNGITTSNITIAISNSPNIISLNGLDGITNAASVSLTNLAGLQNLYGLQQLKNVQTDLIIQDNTALSNLTYLSALTFIGDTLNVTNNDTLCASDVATLQSQLTNSPVVTASGNNGSCDVLDQDGDGIPFTSDCDDLDPYLGNLSFDADCDGYLDASDCSLSDPDSRNSAPKTYLVDGDRDGYGTAWTTVASQDNHACAIDEAGKIDCWGNNQNSQVSGHPTGANYTQVQTGFDHSCALDVNGSIECWGGNIAYMYVVDDVPLTAGFNDLASRDNYACAIQGSDGSVECWGPDYDKVVTDVPALTNITSLTLGAQHVCALDDLGVITCWGESGSNRLNSPTSGGWFAIEAGDDFTCALDVTLANLECWGTYSTTQTDTYRSIAVGDNHVCALKASGELWCDGNNTYGQVNDTPEGTFKTIEAGGNTSCALNLPGQVACWGEASVNYPTTNEWTRLISDGELFCALSGSGAIQCWGPKDAYNQQSGTPANVRIQCTAPTSDYATVGGDCDDSVPGSLTTAHYFDVDNDGHGGPFAQNSCLPLPGTSTLNDDCDDDDDTVWSGSLYYPDADSDGYGSALSTGQFLCTPETGYASSRDDCFDTEASLTGCMSISAGARHTCAVGLNHQVTCWGDNGYGQSDAPIGDFAQVSAGHKHSCAIDLTGQAVCWGDDTYGQSTSPAGTFISVHAAAVHSCALSTSGEAICWGDNTHGQSTPPVGVTFVDLSIAEGSTCGVDLSGFVQCWGNGRQLDFPITHYREVEHNSEFEQARDQLKTLYCSNCPPDADDEIMNIYAFDVGAAHACITDDNGLVQCQGDNTYGQVSPVTASVANLVTTGDKHTCVVTENATVECWGDDTHGQSTVPHQDWTDSPSDTGDTGNPQVVDVDNDGVPAADDCDDNDPNVLATCTDCTGSYLITTTTQLNGLASCKSLDGNLTISTVPTIADLAQLRFLAWISGDLEVTNNADLKSLNGLERLVSVGSLSISGNPLLDSISGLLNLSSAPYLTFNDNGKLVDLTGLEGLAVINDLSLSGNPLLVDLTGLDNLGTATNLTIHSNASLASLAGLDSLTEISFIDIYSSGALTSLDGLQNLETVSEVLAIHENANLLNINELSSLTSVGDAVQIWNNSSLCADDVTDLLANLTTPPAQTSNSNILTGNTGTCIPDDDDDGIPAWDDCDDHDPLIGLGDYYYEDLDQDGYGDAFDPGTQLCTPPLSGSVLNHTDCDDQDPIVQEGPYYYADLDGDGYGDEADYGSRSCTSPADAVTNNWDCDDQDGSGSLATSYYLDEDADTFGDINRWIKLNVREDGFCVVDADHRALCFGSNDKQSISGVHDSNEVRLLGTASDYTCLQELDESGDETFWCTGSTGLTSSPVDQPSLMEGHGDYLCASTAMNGGQTECHDESGLDFLAISAEAPSDVHLQSLDLSLSHACGVDATGNAHCWPATNTYGEVSVPVANSGWRRLAVGKGFTCGLETTGDLQCWGSLLSESPPSNELFRAVAASQFAACGIATDGAIHCWGGDTSGETSGAPSGNDWLLISSNDESTFCATRRSTDDITCWGQSIGTGIATGLTAAVNKSCSVPNGYVTNALDCDDHSTAFPFAVYADLDEDGFGDESSAPDYVCAVGSFESDTQDDCDDDNADIFPGQLEICNGGVDDDCDGDADDADSDVDPSGFQQWYADSDADGYGDASQQEDACDVPVGYIDDATDCDDTTGLIHPGATEVCNGVDDDCDFDIDEGLSTDADSDGYTSAGSCEGSADDCDDANAAINNGSNEICGDGIDQDCSGSDEECQATVSDEDGDGYCAGAACTDGSLPGDCDDDDDTISPAAEEVCDGIDNDCNGLIDDKDTANLVNAPTWYDDQDSDGFGDPTVSLTACIQPAGYIATAGDCDDNDADENPNVSWYADVDGDTFGDPASSTTCERNAATDVLDNTDCDDSDSDEKPGVNWYADQDGDGFGDDASERSCERNESDDTVDNTDCDDNDPANFPGNTEVCDGADNNCDALVDDDDPSVSDATFYYQDTDGDGHGDAHLQVYRCDAPFSYVESADDCDDTEALINPLAQEVCDGVDNDCDTQIDDDDTSLDQGTTSTFYEDADGDGYGNTQTVQACQQPSNASIQTGDCNDTNDTMYPGAPEICNNNIDEDCSHGGNPAGDLPCSGDDNDNDCYCDGQTCVATSSLACPASEGGIQPGDCDDTNPMINPSYPEILNCVDDDCNFVIDDGYLHDADQDGYTSVGDCMGSADDCNDYLPNTNIASPEVCNDGIDNNCDGDIDEYEFNDDDGDGFAEAGDCIPPELVDCEPDDPNSYPGAPEVLDDGIDNDCDGEVDVDPRALDNDLDGFCEGIDLDGDGSEECFYESDETGDCDDDAPAKNPAALEIYDGIDNNCDGVVDNIANGNDLDGDGFTTGTSATSDCNDFDALVHPAAPERCNGLDDNCDGYLSPQEVDYDSDGHVECFYDPDTWVGNPAVYGGNDCEPKDPRVWPGRVEDCADGIDNNCNNLVDVDADNDSDGVTTCKGDCNDGDPNVRPGMIDICNGIDDNCNGQVDEHSDKDGDGERGCLECPYLPENACDCDDLNYLINHSQIENCVDGIDNNCDGEIDVGGDFDKDGTDICDGDCNDSDPTINPFVADRCNGRDDDCDGEVDEDHDADGDGFTPCQGDCNNDANTVYPLATELCDGVDNDCDFDASGEDDDQDGYFNVECGGTDCSDDNELVHPDAVEECDDQIDNNCDLLIDSEDTQECAIDTPDSAGKGIPPGWFCATATAPASPVLFLPLLVALSRRREQFNERAGYPGPHSRR